jgi:hypothetical protein
MWSAVLVIFINVANFWEEGSWFSDGLFLHLLYFYVVCSATKPFIFIYLCIPKATQFPSPFFFPSA